MLDEEVIVKGIVTRGHGRVRGECTLRRHRFETGIERASERELFAQQFEGEERSVPFIDVPHRGAQTQLAQRARATDARGSSPGGCGAIHRRHTAGR